MRPRNHTLDRRQVHRAAAEHLQAHLKSKDYNRKASAQVLWSLLLAATARITSLSDACGRLRDAPSDETARKALLATLPDYAVLQRQLNAAPAGHLPKALRRRLQRLAIDRTVSAHNSAAWVVWRDGPRSDIFVSVGVHGSSYAAFRRDGPHRPIQGCPTWPSSSMSARSAPTSNRYPIRGTCGI